jgi:hypothetical protein
MAGDELMSVSGKDVSKLNPSQIAPYILGPPNSTVTLGFRAKGSVRIPSQNLISRSGEKKEENLKNLHGKSFGKMDGRFHGRPREEDFLIPPNSAVLHGMICGGMRH